VELAKALHASETNLSRIVDRMVRSNFVMREPNPRDRRSIIIRLSPQGQAYIEEEQQRHSRNVEGMFKRVAQKDLKTVRDALSKAEAALLSRANVRQSTEENSFPQRN
jgi:DNA-binding MarR family transcriptional regulator